MVIVYSFRSDPYGCKSYIADPQQAMDFILATLALGGGPITVAREEMDEAEYAALPEEPPIEEECHE